VASDVDYSTGEERAGFGLQIVEQVAAAHGRTGGESGGARFESRGATVAGE
jgi:hypothetical protein